MILKNYKIRRYLTSTKEWDIVYMNQKEYLSFIQSKYKLPGEYNLNNVSNLFLQAKDTFVTTGSYTDVPEDSVEWVTYWEEEAFKCVHGIIVDDFFITGAHYMYCNFLQINDKVRGIAYFPNLWDSDIWFFYSIDIAQLTGKDLAIVKKRQFGSSFKLAAYIIRITWFFESKICKIFNTDISHVEDTWQFLDDYKQFLNEHTDWYREFSPDKTLYWKQQQSVTKQSSKGVKEIKVGRKNIIKGVTTKLKPSAVVGGKCDFYFAEEAGKNPTLDKSNNFLQKAMRFGNLKTGFFVAAGSVGDLNECEPLKKYILNPEANGFLSFSNVWSGRPNEKIGMFVPENYSYGDCIDEFGNSLLKEANAKIDTWLEEIKNKL
jgi:hypothetical protein